MRILYQELGFQAVKRADEGLMTIFKNGQKNFLKRFSAEALLT